MRLDCSEHTRYFSIHTNSPIDLSPRAVDVQIPQPLFHHTIIYCSCLLISSYPKLAARARRRMERIHYFGVRVAYFCIRIGGRTGRLDAPVQEAIKMSVLFLLERDPNVNALQIELYLALTQHTTLMFVSNRILPRSGGRTSGKTNVQHPLVWSK